MPQIWALYSIVGLTTAVYSSRVRLNDGPQVDAAIRDTAAKAGESPVGRLQRYWPTMASLPVLFVFPMIL